MEVYESQSCFGTDCESIRPLPDIETDAEKLRKDDELPMDVGALDIPEINARRDGVS